MSKQTLYTIGFTQKNAEQFFSILQQAGIRKIIDVRLNNVSQLAGFAKRDDLRYFLSALCGIEYCHRPDWAPTAELLKGYREKTVDWDTYERAFTALIRERSIEKTVDRAVLDKSCLLCSEPEATHCHRRLVAEYLNDTLGDIELCHL